MINIEAIKRRILDKYPSFANIIINIPVYNDNSIDTACTNGREIRYNESFLSGLSESEQEFIYAHEVCHIAFDHLVMSQGKDQEIFNIAADAVINAQLSQDGLKQPNDTINIPEARYYTVDELYNKLMKQRSYAIDTYGLIFNHNEWITAIAKRFNTIMAIDNPTVRNRYLDSIQFEIDDMAITNSQIGENQVFDNNRAVVIEAINQAKKDPNDRAKIIVL